ncbi:MAG TPA: hypothetical protein VML95_01945 [Longimicrobiales bacterium]|nr:hypothetical protein [Longimicrobiales bacterium]
MAIGDLLWACPFCGAVGAIQAAGRGRSVCSACGSAYRRGRGSLLIAHRPGAEPEVRPASEWLQALPTLAAALGAGNQDGRVLREDMVEATVAGPDEAVRRGGEVLGFRETAGESLTGALRLEGATVTLEEDSGARRAWALEDLTAIQSSSRVVQIKPRGRPVVTFRFRTGSPRLWEELLQLAMRRLYRTLGRGEIREFQPRIVVR